MDEFTPSRSSVRDKICVNSASASEISDDARVRLAVLKIYGIPVRVFTRPMSGFSASTFGETPYSRLRARCHSGAFPDTYIRSKSGTSAWLAADDYGVLVRVQMLDGSDSTTLIRLSRPARLRLGMPATTWVFAENTNVIGLIVSILVWVSS